MGNEEERRLILEMIDSGKITAEEGLQLLQALPADQIDDYSDDEELSGLLSEPPDSSFQPAAAVRAGPSPADLPPFEFETPSKTALGNTPRQVHHNPPLRISNAGANSGFIRSGPAWRSQSWAAC